VVVIMSDLYRPPYTITPSILRLVGEIGEWIGRYFVAADATLSPRLRRGNRIRTIHASLAIENNTLTIEQVTAVLDGKRVMGLPREIQEVRNAFATYEHIDRWTPSSRTDLLEAHGILMAGLVDRPGEFRSGGVGVFHENRVVHMAPPAERVPSLMSDLLTWLEHTDEHPLVASCVFHYEFEFIHPFPDGNGRLGRLWQTLILSRWKPLLAYLPVETVIHDRQADYYRVLAQADNSADATPFVEFMLEALRSAIEEAVTIDQVGDHVSDQVIRLLNGLRSGETGATDLMARLSLSHRPTFRRNYLEPALTAGLIERTQPVSPRSPTQRYRLTEKGRAFLARRENRKTRHD
jgi:Fic family protein/predicted transcriptional regulator